MAADQRCSGEDDGISGLPDELLHDILVRLGCARAAARTSVLARRWRHVWAHLPELRLDHWQQATSGSFRRGSNSRRSTWWERSISMCLKTCHCLLVVRHCYSFEPEVVEDEGAAVLELPPCQGAKRIELTLRLEWLLRLQASFVFTARTSMKIMLCRMEGSELTSLVSRQCPCLRDLALSLELIAVSDVSMHSDSLRSLMLHVRYTRRLEVMAPKLEELNVHDPPVEAYISASKIAMVAWDDPYDPHLHRFPDVGRSLRLLETSQCSAFLTKQFDEVDRLKLRVNIPQGVTGYESFLNETNKLPKCKSYEIYLAQCNHALVPIVLQLLRNCISTKKFLILLLDSWSAAWWHSCPPSCPCCLEANHKIDGISLSSLEEIEIREFTDSLENMELLEFLSCNAQVLKRLVINYTMFPAPPRTKEVCEKVHGICHANVEVKFNVFHRGRLVPFG